MRSMTGYGRAEYKGDGFELSAEIKTVNNRFLDINFKYPRGFAPLEEHMRGIIKSGILRGRADVLINFTDNREQGGIEADTALAAAYFAAAKKISEATGLDISGVTLSDCLRFTEVIKTGNDTDREFLKDALSQVLNAALLELNQMRQREGERLKKDMLSRLDEIESSVTLLSAHAPTIAEQYREKLTQKVSEFLKDTAIDQSRILSEVAVFSDRSSIDEEIIRLKSHILQFRKISGEGECGKKLDFLLQEFNREANTVCSKSSDIAVTGFGLKIKCEIEKIREQVQNIE